MPRTARNQPIDDRLLDTAIEQFGTFGIEGASTRAIAAAAGTAMSSITYHFGGKDGLYRAAANHIAEQIRARMQGPLAASIAAAGRDPGAAPAIDAVIALVDGFAHVMTSPESAPWARFIVREQMSPTPAFDILYSEFMKRIAEHVAGLVVRIGGGAVDDAQARVITIAIIGQALAFRVARETALRLTGWVEIGEAEARTIRETLRAQTRAILEGIRGGRP
jgi:AcrR family transcriptional regulator